MCAADPPCVVAHAAAAALVAAEADAAVEHVAGAAAVSLAHGVAVHQRIDEEVDGALMLALHRHAHG